VFPGGARLRGGPAPWMDKPPGGIPGDGKPCLVEAKECPSPALAK
jgi:hypothetical protein